MKRLFAMLLAAAMCAGLICAPASAATAEESLTPDLVETQDIGIVPFAENKPAYSVIHNLAVQKYPAELVDLAANRGSYTKTCFITGSDKINLKFTLYHSGTTQNYSRSLTVTLYEYYVWIDDGWNTHYDVRKVASKTLTYNSSQEVTRNMSFTGLDGSTHYYFLFDNISSSNPKSGYDISADIDITQ